MVSIETEVPARGSQAAAISNHVVRTMSEYTGRGPTKARTYINQHAVTVVLHDTLTKGEHSLVSDDLDGLVLTMRKAFHGTMGQVLIDGVEEILGRKVIAFMSDNHIDPDIAVEVFVLAPADAEQRGDAAGGVAKTPTDTMAGSRPSLSAGT
ncbi:MAG TPA: Na-translocating system protein MpsC family protein [Solirubrobacteraceae bacterium]|nr:Na-translocating system protein MpsC family protein [Solirubrobacteraceae bacterium]